MYLQHFGFREMPFGLTPDTSFFYSSGAYQEALNTLLVATREGEGFIKIVGEVGTGKTMLSRKFMASLGEDYVTAYVPNPYLEPLTLLRAIVEDLGVARKASGDQHRLLKTLTQGLMDFARQDKRVVLCLDEAQAMPLETLEALRLLTNLETEKRKLLQIVLFGQPELDSRLDSPSIRQLKQRITFHYRLGALSRDELEYYVNHRINVAGHGGGRLFSGAALRLLHRASGGIPRLINILGHKALMMAYGHGRPRVDWRDMRAAVKDTPAARPLRWVW